MDVRTTKRSVMIVALVAVAIIAPAAGLFRRDRKVCYCDMKYGTTQLESDDSANGLHLLEDLVNPIYSHWLRVSCNRINSNCANACKAKAHEWMGGAHFNRTMGKLACQTVARNAPPSNKLHVYATYSPSSCGGLSWQHLAPLCCWELKIPGYGNYYLHNYQCLEQSPPSLFA